MSITTELREWAKRSMVLPPQETESILAIADRIDAEHESNVSYWQGASYKDGYDEGFASADDWLAQHEDAMAEHGWVRLPVDADGVPIRVGDEMEPISVKYDRFGVVTLCLDTRDGRWSLLTDLDGEWSHDEMCQLRHYTPPTVEDVLREFALRVTGKEVGSINHDTVAEYAAKLRLAGDGE